MNLLVSVIIPIYNVEQYLDKCIESIVKQTYSNIEIILVDDGGKDSCPKKCDEWSKIDSRIKVIHKENEGVAYARNSGLDIASGEYILFVDSDDYIAFDAVEIMVKRIEQDNTDIVIAKTVKVYSNDEVSSGDNSNEHYTVITKDEAMHKIGDSKDPLEVYVCNKLYRKHIFKDFRFLNLKRAEDVYMLPHIIDRCEKITMSDAVLYFYFQRDNSAVHSSTYEQKLDSILAALHVSRFLLDRGYLKEARVYYHSAIVQFWKISKSGDAKKLIEETFTLKQRKSLERKKSFFVKISILKYKYPKLYKIYNNLLKK